MAHHQTEQTDKFLERMLIVGLVALALLLIWPKRLQSTTATASGTAAAEFVCTPERIVCGWARLTEQAEGVEVVASLSGLTPGLYSIALMDSARCGEADAARLFRLRADVTRANELAPLARKPAAQFQTNANGSARVAFVVPGATLGHGMNSLTAGDGSALAVSPTRTDREAACGVVEAGPSNLLSSPRDMMERF